MLKLFPKNKIDWYENGIDLFTVFHLNCYGIHLFLGVGDIDDETGMLHLYELKTVRYKDGVALSYNSDTGTFRAKDKKECLISPRNKPNCWSKAQLRCYPIKNKKGEIILPFEIEIGSKLYEQMKKVGIYKEYLLPSLNVVFKFIGNRKDYEKLAKTYWPCEINTKIVEVDEVVYYA